MPGKSTCPDQATLQHLQKGLILDPEASDLRRHLQDCSACSASWKRIGEETAHDLPAGEVSAAKARARRLLLDEPTDFHPAKQGIDTPPTAASEPPTESGGESPEKFFRPAEQAGELGRLGNYRILRLLSQGGMGMVYLAEDINLGRKVALKVIRPEQATTQSARQRFLQEARAVAAIQHDHIVTIYQVDQDQNMLYLAMQLLQGESLGERLVREGPLPVADVIRIGRQVAEGLGAAHAHGLIHRDVKPGNIFLERIPGKPQSRVKLLDFGLARQVASAQTGLTQAGLIIGTPGYMAPEQARNLPLDQRCDLFSLGCVMFQMATGEQPFKGDDPIALLVAMTVDPVPLLSQLRPDVPSQLSDFVDRLLSKSPNDRPRNAEIVADALSQLEQKQTKNRIGTIVDTPKPDEKNGPKTQSKHPKPATPSPDLTPASGIMPVVNWEPTDGTSKPMAAPPSGWQSSGSSQPDDDPAGKRSPILDAMKSPAATTTANAPTRSVLPVPESCPKCEGKVRNMPGRSWCLKCGWDSTAAAEEEANQAAPEQPFSWRMPLWVIVLLFGCVAIITITSLRGMVIPKGSVGTWVLVYWILIEGVCGLMLYFSGHFWLLSIVLHEMRESELLKYFDPTYVWRYGFTYLPRTRGSLILGSWGALLFISAFIIFAGNDFSFKFKHPEKIPVVVGPGNLHPPDPDEDLIDIPSADESGDGTKKLDENLNLLDLRDKDRPEDVRMLTTECFVIGYTSSKTDANGQPIMDTLLLGTRSEEGQIYFAGGVPVSPEWEKQASQFRRQVLPIVNPTVKVPAEFPNAVLVEPSLNWLVTVNYKEQDTAKRLKEMVMQGFSLGKKETPRP